MQAAKPFFTKGSVVNGSWPLNVLLLTHARHLLRQAGTSFKNFSLNGGYKLATHQTQNFNMKRGYLLLIKSKSQYRNARVGRSPHTQRVSEVIIACSISALRGCPLGKFVLYSKCIFLFLSLSSPTRTQAPFASLTKRLGLSHVRFMCC